MDLMHKLNFSEIHELDPILNHEGKRYKFFYFSKNEFEKQIPVLVRFQTKSMASQERL